MTKKKIIIIAVAGFVIFSGILTALIINFNSKPKTVQQVFTPSKQTADNLKEQATEAIKDKDNVKAKELLTQARRHYEALNDSEATINIDSLIYFIDHPTTPPATSGGQATPVTSNN